MKPSSIAYSDGEAVEALILSYLRQAPDVSSQTSIAASQYGEWAVRYHLSPLRSNLLRHFDFSGLKVIELGAGMGAVSRFLAEECDHLTIVEGTESRFTALSERLRDLTNWTGSVKNIQDYETDERFDVVCVVGVLEYSEIYVTPPSGESPFEHFLKRAKQLLRPGGVLLLAIENQVGLKYWAGAPEDHTGFVFDGICGYPTKPSPRTFGRSKLKALLNSVGLERVEEFHPWPDYKLPLCVLTPELSGANPQLYTELAGDSMSKDAREDVYLFSQKLALITLVEEGLASEFTNSFLFAATGDKTSAILDKLMRRRLERSEVGWHYNITRQLPTSTTFQLGQEGKIAVRKEQLETGHRAVAEDLPVAIENDDGPQVVIDGPKLSTVLLRMAFFDDKDGYLTQLEGFLRWSLKRWSLPDGSGLQGEALDATVLNAIKVDHDEGYGLFDLEWSWKTAIRPSWFLLRNILLVRADYRAFQHPPFSRLADLYTELCKRLGVPQNLEEDLADEASLQFTAFQDIAVPEIIAALTKALNLDTAAPSRRSITNLEGEVERLRIENHHLGAELTRKSVRIAMQIDRGFRKIPFFHSGMRRLARIVRGTPPADES